MSVSVSEASVESTAIEGLLVIRPKTVTDARGTVREMFRASSFPGGMADVPADVRWAQVNLTSTVCGAVRGLHGEAMTKLVGLASGTAFGAWVDTRAGSATFGTVVTMPLEVGVQVLVPAGVCNGFQATSEQGCEYLYCFDREWEPGLPGTALTPLDPALGIAWPVEPILSDKDANAPTLADLTADLAAEIGQVR